VARDTHSPHQDLEMAFLGVMEIAIQLLPYEDFQWHSLTDHCGFGWEVPELVVVHNWLGEDGMS
jgi:hypothetical protein